MLRAGQAVQWEREDGGMGIGEYRCALAVDPAVAIVACRDGSLARVLHLDLRVQAPDPPAVRGPNPVEWSNR